MCDNFYLFEPICTAILLAICSGRSMPWQRLHVHSHAPPVIHCIRIHAIYDQDRKVLAVMGSLTAVQIVVTAICCGFYRCESMLGVLALLLTLVFSGAAGTYSGLHRRS
jgi:hypothetical protein